MKILLVEPGKAPEEKNISGTLDSMQEAVGGTIQAIYPFDEPVALVCNDEAKLLGMKMNRLLTEIGDIICGPFFLCGAPAGSEKFTSLSAEQMAQYRKRFSAPEAFLSIDGAIFAIKM